MSATFVSSQYLANAFVLPVMQTQTQLSAAAIAESTGEFANLGLRLGAQSGQELSLREQADQLQALTSGNSLVATNLATAQAALDSIGSTARTAIANLAAWTPSAGASAQLSTIGDPSLQSLVNSANASVGGQYVFGGINSATPPMAAFSTTPASPSAAAVTTAFIAAFGFAPTSASAATVTATPMQTFLNGPYAALFQGASWSADWSSASNVNTTAEIAPGKTITTGSNANQAGFQQLAQGYAMLSAFAGTSLGNDAMQAVVTASSSLIAQGSSSITNLQTTLGAAQSAVTDANNVMTAQTSILQTRIGALDNVDPNKTAAEISALTNQLQIAYDLTSRLHGLNLAQYLPIA